MKICFFGDYSPEYVRTKVMLDGLRLMNVPVVEVNERGKGALFRLFKHYRALSIDSHDVVFVAYSDSRLLPLFAKLISRKPVIWDPLYSLYDNWVFDRKFTQPHSIKAKYYWLLDWIGCKASDHIVLDTLANAEYFSREFNVPMKNFTRVLTGADPSVFTPLSPLPDSEQFEVEFHGKYIPVHGVDVIIGAAEILRENKDIHFTLIGKGQTLAQSKRTAEELHLDNITFVPFVPINELPAFLKKSHVTIGLLGDVPRIVRAIPGKMYEASASRRATINADTPALREIYVNDHDCIAIQIGDPQALADAIIKLKDNRAHLQEIASNAYETYLKNATPEYVARDLVTAIKKLGLT